MRMLTVMALLLGAGLARAESSTAFLEFPMVEKVAGASRADAFAWIIHQGSATQLRFAKGPEFAPVTLVTKADEDGEPITSVAISADGSLVLYNTADPLGGERAANPASRIEPPQPTVWIIEAKAGAKPQKVGAGVGGSFAPDGHRFLYARGEDLHLFDPGAKSEDSVAVKGGAKFGETIWLNDGSGVLFAQDRGGYGFIGRYAFGGDRVEWLVTGADRLGGLRLSPGGNRIAWLRFPAHEHSRVYDMTASEPFAVEVMDLDTRATRELWKTDRPAQIFFALGEEQALRFVGDDRLVFESEVDGWTRLYGVAASGGGVTALTPSRCETAESTRAGPLQILTIHNCVDLETRQISIVDATNGQTRALPIPEKVAADAASANEGHFVAFAAADARSPALLRIVEMPSGHVALAEKAEDYGWHGEFSAPDPVSVTFKAEDGVLVHAQLFLPGGSGKHPGLVYVHGGPPRQMFPAFHFMGYYADDYAMNRKLAELGYAVLSVNYRSGVGYGQAYREDPGRAWRNASEYRDVIAGGRFLAARPEVDGKRIGIWGGSYGGLLTGQALARNSDLFKAGVAIHGVYDWSWPSPKPGHLSPSRFFGVDPDKDKARALKNSPLGAIKTWRSPVLLFHGDADMNVDVLETVDLAQRLRDQHVEVKTVIVPNEPHDFVRHATWVKLWQEMSDFFASHLGTR